MYVEMSIEENIKDYRYTDHIKENNMVAFNPDKMEIMKTVTDNVKKDATIFNGLFCCRNRS